MRRCEKRVFGKALGSWFCRPSPENPLDEDPSPSQTRDYIKSRCVTRENARQKRRVPMSRILQEWDSSACKCGGIHLVNPSQSLNQNRLWFPVHVNGRKLLQCETWRPSH